MADGVGHVHLFGGDRFGRVAVHAAGGTEIRYWDGSQWRVGSEMESRAAGFTLLEVVIALFLIAVGVTATAPLFVYASQENAAGGDMGEVGSTAARQMERLRAEEFGLLANGGSLTADVAGFFDDSHPDVRVRWTIVDNPNPPAGTKVLTVRALALGNPIGRPKEVTLVAVRGL